MSSKGVNAKKVHEAVARNAINTLICEKIAIKKDEIIISFCSTKNQY